MTLVATQSSEGRSTTASGISRSFIGFRTVGADFTLAKRVDQDPRLRGSTNILGPGPFLIKNIILSESSYNVSVLTLEPILR